jgi:hypothetical protein
LIGKKCGQKKAGFCLLLDLHLKRWVFKVKDESLPLDLHFRTKYEQHFQITVAALLKHLKSIMEKDLA